MHVENVYVFLGCMSRKIEKKMKREKMTNIINGVLGKEKDKRKNKIKKRWKMYVINKTTMCAIFKDM